MKKNTDKSKKVKMWYMKYKGDIVDIQVGEFETRDEAMAQINRGLRGKKLMDGTKVWCVEEVAK